MVKAKFKKTYIKIKACETKIEVLEERKIYQKVI